MENKKTITDIIQECCIDYYNNYTKAYENASKKYRGNEGSLEYWRKVFERENKIVSATVNEILKRFDSQFDKGNQ